MVSLITEYKPLFPAYYYTDATVTQQAAAVGKPSGSMASRAYTGWNRIVFKVIGPRWIIAKAANCTAAAMAVYFLGLAFGWEIALVVAVWPSHIFFTSQNFKDSFIIASTCWSVWSIKQHRVPLGIVPLMLLRGFVAWILAAAFAIAGHWRKFPVKLVVAACASAIFFRYLFSGPLRIEGSDPTHAVSTIPTSYDMKAGEPVAPYSPQGIARFRKTRQDNDRNFAQREIGTQLFYGQEFKTWLDVVLFIPKGSVNVLFMPLPIFSPLPNIGRTLSAIENLAVLTLTIFCVFRIRRIDQFKAGVLLFVILNICVSALFEPDLGSAARHKILYLPLLWGLAE